MKKTTPKKDTSLHIEQREPIDFELKIKEFPWSEKQREFIDLALDKKTKVIFVKGPAGSAKSLLAAYVSLILLAASRVKEIHYIRQPVESSAFKMGFLPGEQDDKMAPYIKPLLEKLKELLTALLMCTSHDPNTRRINRDKAVELEEELDKLMGFE